MEAKTYLFVNHFLSQKSLFADQIYFLTLKKLLVMNVKIQAVQFTADQKLLDLIEKKVQKFEQLYDRITSIEVHLKLDNQSKQVKDKVVSIKCNIPGTQLYAEDTSKLFEDGIDSTVSSIKRQLKRYKEKMRAN